MLSKALLATLLVFTFNLVQAQTSKMLNGIEVPKDHLLRKSTVALVKKSLSRSQVICTGVVLSNRLVLSAGHCVLEWADGELYIGSGTNPLKGKLIAVKELRIRASHDLDHESTGDVTLIRTVEDLTGFEPVTFGNPDDLNKGSKFIQAGYGFNTKNEIISWPYFGKLLMHSTAKFESFSGFSLNLITIKNKDVLGGDSGGPVYREVSRGLELHGILSTGGPGNANYTHPAFALNWINCALPQREHILTQVVSSNQIPCGDSPWVSMSDLPRESRQLCEAYKPGWTIIPSGYCWPATELSCSLHAEHTQEDLRWDSSRQECIIPD